MLTRDTSHRPILLICENETQDPFELLQLLSSLYSNKNNIERVPASLLSLPQIESLLKIGSEKNKWLVFEDLESFSNEKSLSIAKLASSEL